MSRWPSCAKRGITAVRGLPDDRWKRTTDGDTRAVRLLLDHSVPDANATQRDNVSGQMNGS